MNLKEIEKLLLKHLEESGEIRTDLKWLKRAFWTLVTLIPAQEAIRHLWR